MRKKKNLQEELYRMKYLAGIISEAAPAQQATTQQAVGQQTRQQTPAQQNPQQIEKNIETTMEKGMDIIIKQLPNILKTYATTQGDKDGKIEIPGARNQNQQQSQGQAQKPIQENGVIRELKFDENKYRENFTELNEGGILGLIASAPAIMQLGGKFLSWTGKKANADFLKKWGEKLAHKGHELHHSYIGIIDKALAPFMPNVHINDRKKAAEAIFTTIVALLFAQGISAPDMLTSIKGGELAANAAKMLPKAMATSGLT